MYSKRPDQRVTAIVCGEKAVLHRQPHRAPNLRASGNVNTTRTLIRCPCLGLPLGAAASQTRSPPRACQPMGSPARPLLPANFSMTTPPLNPHSAFLPSELNLAILNQSCRLLPCSTARFICQRRAAVLLLFSTHSHPSCFASFDSRFLQRKHHVFDSLHVSVSEMSDLQSLVSPIPFHFLPGVPPQDLIFIPPPHDT